MLIFQNGNYDSQSLHPKLYQIGLGVDGHMNKANYGSGCLTIIVPRKLSVSPQGDLDEKKHWQGFQGLQELTSHGCIGLMLCMGLYKMQLKDNTVGPMIFV